MGGKYSNVLTMFLIIFIVAIFGIIGYFMYDLYNSSSVNSNAQSVLEDLDKASKKVKNATVNKTNVVDDNNVTAENAVSYEELMNQMGGDNATQNDVVEQPVVSGNEENRPEPEKVYMEDYEVLGRIEIPKTKVDYPVLEKTTKRTLEIAVSYAYGPGLNEAGNTVIYGHNYRNGLFFSNNKKLTSGDSVFITDVYGNRIEYIIYNIYQTTSNDATFFRRPTNGRREVSLQTCTDDSSGRIIIWACEKEHVSEARAENNL